MAFGEERNDTGLIGERVVITCKNLLSPEERSSCAQIQTFEARSSRKEKARVRKLDGTSATKRERSLIATVIKSLKGAGGGEEETVVQKNARPVPEARSSVPPPRTSRPCRRARVHRCRDISQPAGRPAALSQRGRLVTLDGTLSH